MTGRHNTMTRTNNRIGVAIVLSFCMLAGGRSLSGQAAAQACPPGFFTATDSGHSCGCQKHITGGSSLPVAEVAKDAYQAGFRCDGLVNAIAVASAESSYVPVLVDENATAAGQFCSYDVGLWQINTRIWDRFPAHGTPPTAPSPTDQAVWLFNAMKSPGGPKWGHPDHGGGSFWGFGNAGYCQSLSSPDPAQNACNQAASVTNANPGPSFASCGSQLCTSGPTLPPYQPPLPGDWTGSGPCPASTPPCTGPNCPIIGVVSAGDPNDKSGVRGIGVLGWIPSQSLTYSINFSNEPTASAPAQTVVVSDVLNPATFDLSSVSLGPVNLGNTFVTPVSGPLAVIGTYTSALDLRPATNLIVGITAALNLAGGALTWTFTSIDPATGQPTTDPLAGFLPPGSSGSVTFSVAPKTPVTGSQISNTATVVFDFNPPMKTPAWLNTIDGTPPSSRVASLPTSQSTSCFKPQWSGTDVGSGVRDFSIYASDNGGPYTAWLTNTTVASGVYTGAPGHVYAFYSQARDLAGNVEAAKALPDATTTVGANASCSGQPSLSGAVAGKSASGSTMTLVLQLTNTGVGMAQSIVINQIVPRTLSGSGTVTVVSPTAPVSEGSLVVGASTTASVILNVPSTVTRFSLTENGSMQDNVGKTFSYSIAQTIIP